VLVFDENLAGRLVAALADLYPGCAHVGERGLAVTPITRSGGVRATAG
jgi:hypothetical protein